MSVFELLEKQLVYKLTERESCAGNAQSSQKYEVQ